MNPYNKKVSLKPIKIREDEYRKMVMRTGELTMIEGKRVSLAELQRRILNIPNLDTVLKSDSIMNKRRVR